MKVKKRKQQAPEQTMSMQQLCTPAALEKLKEYQGELMGSPEEIAEALAKGIQIDVVPKLASHSNSPFVLGAFLRASSP